MGVRERQLLVEAFDSNWIAPLGPFVDRFEADFARYLGVASAAALSSGTAALHLALILLGVGANDRVFLPSLTFAATANAVRYVGATPVLMDCERESWGLDPDLLADELGAAARRGELPAAVIAVDLYGQCPDYARVRAACERWGVPVVEDAAEALGAFFQGEPAGTLGDIGVFSFNGNKIITTSGGGMLVSRREQDVNDARFLATQAREPVPWYEHSCVGYNYRLSNLLAAVGIGQLERIDRLVQRRREIYTRYHHELADVAGVKLMPRDVYGESSCWLTCLTLDPSIIPSAVEEVRAQLQRQHIEVRQVWKPMHLQTAFSDCPCVGGSVAEELSERGLCLPSGSALTPRKHQRVVRALRQALGAA